MRGTGLLALVTVAAVGAAACDRGGPEGAGPTPIPVSEECTTAFDEATRDAPTAQPTPTATASPISLPIGALIDLAPTVPACRDAEEWMEAYRGHRQDATTGVPPISALQAICEAVPDEEVSGSEVCSDVLVGSPSG